MGNIMMHQIFPIHVLKNCWVNRTIVLKPGWLGHRLPEHTHPCVSSLQSQIIFYGAPHSSRSWLKTLICADCKRATHISKLHRAVLAGMIGPSEAWRWRPVLKGKCCIVFTVWPLITHQAVALLKHPSLPVRLVPAINHWRVVIKALDGSFYLPGNHSQHWCN